MRSPFCECRFLRPSNALASFLPKASGSKRLVLTCSEDKVRMFLASNMTTMFQEEVAKCALVRGLRRGCVNFLLGWSSKVSIVQCTPEYRSLQKTEAPCFCCCFWHCEAISEVLLQQELPARTGDKAVCCLTIWPFDSSVKDYCLLCHSCWLFSVSDSVIIRYHQRNGYFFQVNKRIHI